jgi:HTH-type transcriptional regulator/antitoxin HipB
MENYARTPKQIGHVLQRIRHSSHLTQGELGVRSGLWQETISKVESGAGGTKLETFCDILAALDLELIILPRRKSASSDIEDMF